MKLSAIFRSAQLRRVVATQAGIAVLAVALIPDAAAQGTNPVVSATVGSQTVADASTGTLETQKKQSPGEEEQAAKVSPAVQDILKLSDAEVSSEVIVAFIQHSRVGYEPTATDLIALKKHNVPDEVTSALMKRGAEIEAQTAQMKADAVAPTIVRRLSRGSYLDPDSYDFWYYHYAYPRALSYSYRTLRPAGLRYGPRVLRSPYGRPQW